MSNHRSRPTAPAHRTPRRATATLTITPAGDAWIAAGRLRLLRRARGFAPLPVTVPRELPVVLGVGAHLKNTVALSVGRQVFVSQHVGDRETEVAMGAFERVIADFQRLYEVRPAWIAHDLHPDYLSTRWARAAAGREPADGGAPPRLVGVQHHHAHLAACLAENGVEVGGHPLRGHAMEPGQIGRHPLEGGLRLDRLEVADVLADEHLPVTHGEQYTRWHIFFYTLILFAVSLLPFAIGMSGLIYLLAAVALGAGFIYWAVALLRNRNPAAPMETFRYSIVYLAALFLALLIDHYFLFDLTTLGAGR